MAEQSVYLNGSIIPLGCARIGISDAGFLHGASVFTTMLAHNGRVFRLDRHLSRLMETAEFVDIQTDATADLLRAAVEGVIGVNGLREARVRITLTPGKIGEGKPVTLVTAEELQPNPEWWYDDGISVVESSISQPVGTATAGLKTGCYFPRVQAYHKAEQSGAAEALWYTVDRCLAEACFSNVFLVSNNQVRTPPLDTPVLPGIVRQTVIEICEQFGVRCDDKTPLGDDDISNADEIFLTASCAGIRPVVKVEGKSVAGGKPGHLTKKITTSRAIPTQLISP